MQELTLLKDSKKGLIIHHWDTDGLASAALLLSFFSKLNSNIKVKLFTPTIGNFYLTTDQYAAIEKAEYDFIITCDINFPEDVVMKLSEIKPGKVFVFDHHKQDPIKGVFYYNKRYPACTLVINEYLQNEMSLLTCLGPIGDKEEKIKQDEAYWPIIEKVLEQEGVSFAQALEMRNLIDSCYIADDYSGIEETIKILQTDPLLVSQDENLRHNLENTNKELANVVNGKADDLVDNAIFVLNIKSSFNVLSHATRALSRKYSDKIILTWQYKNEQTNIYIRRRDLEIDVSPLITWARAKGCNSGGKEEVVGIIYNGDFNEIKDELIAEIKNITLAKAR